MKFSWSYFLWLGIVSLINWVIADYTFARRYQFLVIGHQTVEAMQEQRIAQMKDWVEEWRARCEVKE